MRTPPQARGASEGKGEISAADSTDRPAGIQASHSYAHAVAADAFASVHARTGFGWDTYADRSPAEIAVARARLWRRA